MAKPYPTVTPYLITLHAFEVIEFLKTAFNATEIHLQKRDDGTVAHASLHIEESMVMLSESTADYPPMPCMIYLYMDDCDECYNKAIAAGGTSLREPTNEAYGDRSSGVKDKGGNQWWIAGPLKN
ncbi:MAG: VOC family protein [Bacteroidota bacterium]|nr:VOC family protein [Bacteroidota bacterium]